MDQLLAAIEAFVDVKIEDHAYNDGSEYDGTDWYKRVADARAALLTQLQTLEQ